MATKTVAWNSGSGVITLTYTGQGNGSVSVKSDANDSFDARSQNLNIVTTEGSPEKAVQVLVKQAGKSLGWTTKDFGYTGSVQEVTLPKGRYKLQCWGAEGGVSSGNQWAYGSLGGYSEGILTLTEVTTLYVFVGGQGASSGNGGWNGGGSSSGHSSYTSGNEFGESYPACGGGATDIATVTSSMDYSNGRTNRSAVSLLARCIVAGGGAGASCRYTTITETVESEEYVDVTWMANQGGASYTYVRTNYSYFVEGNKYRIELSNTSGLNSITLQIRNSTGSSILQSIAVSSDGYFTLPASWPDGANFMYFACVYSGTAPSPLTADIYKIITETTENNSSARDNRTHQGGGINGLGTYGGTQSSGSGEAGFGYGANQKATNYMYCGGAGGGGWYGGGTNKADSQLYAINYGSGGSGFVNTADNASYRPSGYIGLQLDSGSTTAGNSSHPSVSGGTEVGHSGNGYARITVL